MDNFLDTYEVKKATEDIRELEDDIKGLRMDLKERDKYDKETADRIARIEKEQALQGQKLDTLISKQAETSRMIQQTIYGAIATPVIGGLIALVWSQIGGG